MIFCQLKLTICRIITLFCANIWQIPQKAVILHRFSMTPALKVRENTRDAHALARTKNGISLNYGKETNYEKVFV